MSLLMLWHVFGEAVASCPFGGGNVPDLYDSPGFGAEEVGAKYGGEGIYAGGVWYYEGFSTGFPTGPNGGDWLHEDCELGDYEVMWTVASGDSPNINSHIADVWISLDGDTLTIEMDGIAGTGQIEIHTRDAVTLEVINVDAFEMKTE